MPAGGRRRPTRRDGRTEGAAAVARNARAPDLNSQHGGGVGATLVLHVGEGEEADEGMSVVGGGAEEADAVVGRSVGAASAASAAGGAGFSLAFAHSFSYLYDFAASVRPYLSSCCCRLPRGLRQQRRQTGKMFGKVSAVRKSACFFGRFGSEWRLEGERGEQALRAWREQHCSACVAPCTWPDGRTAWPGAE